MNIHAGRWVRSTLSTAIAAALGASSGVALAQSADNEDLQEVVVSGIRHGIETSIA